MEAQEAEVDALEEELEALLAMQEAQERERERERASDGARERAREREGGSSNSEAEEADEELADWGEAEEEGAVEVPAVRRVRQSAVAKAAMVAAGTWVGRPRDRHRGVLRSQHKRAGTWLGRGPRPSSSTGPNVNASPSAAASSTGPG